MSRHRGVRAEMDDYGYDDYDDESDYSYGSVGSLGQSPSVSQFMYDRERVNTSAFVRDSELLASLRPMVLEVVNPHWPQEDVDQALRDADYDVAGAVRWLSDNEAYQQFPIEGDAGDEMRDDDLFQMDEEEPEAPKPKPKPKAKPKPKPAQKVKASSIGTLLSRKPATPVVEIVSPETPAAPFKFDSPSPDDKVLAARKNAKVHTPNAEQPRQTPSASAVSEEVDDRAAKIAGVKQRSAAKNKELRERLDEMRASAKEKLNLVVIGHVDAGKSTLMGHMLHLLGVVSKRDMRKHEKGAAEANKGSFSFAWVLDSNAEERERGVTIDVGQAHFETEKRDVVLLDAPGHLDFVPNMITGAAQAEAALLVIDAGPNAFESGFRDGGQTKEHAQLARALGVRELVVVINKLDLVAWDQGRFEEIREQVTSFLTTQVRYREKDLLFVPCSGFSGENLTKRSVAALTAWYQGPTLSQAIDRFRPVERDYEKPLRLYLTEVLGKVQGMQGVAVAGKLESGLLAPGDKLLLMPLYELATVKTLHVNSVDAKMASSGDYVELGLVGLDAAVYAKGDVLCDPEHPIPVVTKIRANMLVFTPEQPILKGRQVLLHTHSIVVQATISSLRALLDKKTRLVIKKRPRNLPHKCFCEVDITLEAPGMPMELFADYQQFGRFMLRDKSTTIATGLVTKILKTRSHLQKAE